MMIRTTLFRKFVRPWMRTLRTISYPAPNKPLICAFVERWHPETNTFHIPFGEMTITLDDVKCLIGVLVRGNLVQLPIADDDLVDVPELCVKLLGVSLKEVMTEINATKGSSVRLEWLYITLVDRMTSNNEKTVQCFARAYIWCMLGCSILSEKSGGRVGTQYLKLLENVVEAHTYAWGAATLAFLYRQLGLASKFKCRQMGGYMTLLEAWIYEHFPIMRPPQNLKYHSRQPVAARWSPSPRQGARMETLISYRQTLDSLTELDVDWNPYLEIRDEHPFDTLAFCHGCIRSFDIIEPYHPNRVLRKFGYVQRIPSALLGPVDVRSGDTSSRYGDRWGEALEGYFRTWDNHVLSDKRRGQLAIQARDFEPEYIDWYRKYSHPFIQIHARGTNAVHRSINSNAAIRREERKNLRDLLHIPVQKWRDQDATLTLEYAMAQMEQVYILLGGQGRGVGDVHITSFFYL